MLDKKVANVKHGHIVYTCFQNFRKRNKKMTGFTFLFAEKRNQRKKLSLTKNRTTVVIIACLPKIQ